MHRAQQANGGRANAARPANARGGARRTAPGGPRRRLPAKLRLTLFVALVAVAAFGIVRLVGGVSAGSEDCFVDNVYINGVCMSGYTHEEGVALLNGMRDNWMNTAFPLSFNGKTWNFTPASVNAQLDFSAELERAWNLGHVGDRTTRKQIIEGLKQVPAEFESVPTYDEAALKAFISGIAAEVNRDPVDAEVTLTEFKPVITRASEFGWKLDEEQLRDNLVTIIETGSGESELPVQKLSPMVESEDMEMNIIAKFETDVSFRGYDSRSNVRVALEHFNLLSVYPGDQISFNEVVGPRTVATGFKEAPEYAGSRVEMGIGGGVCQASTTLYNAVIQAGMTIIQRYRHTMTVVYVDPSQDAAVDYGNKDFVFRNDTEHPIYIYTNVSKDTATVTIYGKRPEYHYELESVVLKETPSERTSYQDDVDGKHVYYVTDPPVLYKEGHGSCESEGWIVSYDWDTKEEVSRVQVNHDVYSPGLNIYWRGVHDADGSIVGAG